MKSWYLMAHTRLIDPTSKVQIRLSDVLGLFRMFKRLRFHFGVPEIQTLGISSFKPFLLLKSQQPMTMIHPRDPTLGFYPNQSGGSDMFLWSDNWGSIFGFWLFRLLKPQVSNPIDSLSYVHEMLRLVHFLLIWRLLVSFHYDPTITVPLPPELIISPPWNI